MSQLWSIILVFTLFLSCNPSRQKPTDEQDILLTFTLSLQTEGNDLFYLYRSKYSIDSLQLFSASGERIPAGFRSSSQNVNSFGWIPLYKYPEDKSLSNQTLIREFDIIVPSFIQNDEGKSTDSIISTISLRYKVGNIDDLGFGIIELESLLPNIQFPEDVRPTHNYCDIVISE